MPHPTVRCAVRHPETGQMVALDPAEDYADDNPFVLTYPWAFASVKDAHHRIESVSVEKATAEPGQKRNVRRSK